MSIQVVLAIAAAVTSLSIALISALATRNNNRRLEQLRAEITQREVSRALVSQELRDSTAHLDKLIVSIQKFKDEVLIVRELVAEDVLSPEATAPLDNALRFFTDTYAAAVPHLTDTEQESAHTAKAVAIEVQQLLARAVRHRDITGATTQQVLDSRRLELSTLQMELRDARTQRFLATVAVQRA